MNAFIINGLKEAEKVKSEILNEVDSLQKTYGLPPGLAVVRVGDDPASAVYVEKKGQDARAMGFYFEEHYLDGNASQNDVLKTIQSINANPQIHGLILQLPVPAHLNPFKLVNAIDPQKDVDGLHPLNTGLLAQGRDEGFIPCTPLGCHHLIETVTKDLAGLKAVVVGRSILVGRPMALLLIQEDVTVTLTHAKTQKLPKLLKEADLVIAAMGAPRFIKGEWLKEDAIIIDVGINRIQDSSGKMSLTGDVDFESAQERVRAITPVPGGVGPMTRIYLLKNTIKAFKEKLN
ncbi:Bifunctional protein FolD protein [Candidatus Bealeia paramacronuclearis]|uniref:Bifunctional protein FolD n=1 Tax=Candidatus Bealeia paramacronuclearis TaxID=1921001 RepID=A0ABZ2C624_9PROT|nr:Bifunctional protein FolD protein [Candidatus Bealeia paramacronuclearis]